MIAETTYTGASGPFDSRCLNSDGKRGDRVRYGYIEIDTDNRES